VAKRRVEKEEELMLFFEIPSMTSKASKKVSKDGRRSLKAIPVRW
jgi:hypothetical protein